MEIVEKRDAATDANFSETVDVLDEFIMKQRADGASRGGRSSAALSSAHCAVAAGPKSTSIDDRTIKPEVEKAVPPPPAPTKPAAKLVVPSILPRTPAAAGSSPRDGPKQEEWAAQIRNFRLPEDVALPSRIDDDDIDPEFRKWAKAKRSLWQKQ